jgi:hypothetical protein
MVTSIKQPLSRDIHVYDRDKQLLLIPPLLGLSTQAKRDLPRMRLSKLTLIRCHVGFVLICASLIESEKSLIYSWVLSVLPVGVNKAIW